MGRKYGNKKIVVDGITFDSKYEAWRYQELKVKENLGIIHDLRLQVKFVLIPSQREMSDEVYVKGPNKGKKKAGKLIEKECSYFADFVYYEDGEMIVEDAKGMRTAEYIIKRKLMLERYGIRIREV